MLNTHWYVITGAPSSGKTTLINRLTGLGYNTAPEVARDYINHLLAQHQTLSEIRADIVTLQRKILAIKLRREHRLNPKQLILFDRGTPDSLAYFRMHHLNEQPALRACVHRRYQGIFFCHGLPIEHDGIRTEDEATAKKLGELIYNAYAEFQYPIIELPVISIEERLHIILETLSSSI